MGYPSSPTPSPSPDKRLVGCSMGSQGTMELWDGMDKRDLACIPALGLVGNPMGSQGTMGLWDGMDKRDQAYP